MSSSRVRVYMGCSFDGFIAGPDHDVSWLDESYSAAGDLKPDPDVLTFERFMSEVGAILMGRSTYGIVENFGQWHYGETPVLVATHRPLEPMTDTIQAVSGPIQELIERAKDMAGGRDVYVDGGDLVRQALNAGLVDEITATFLPVLLGKGVRLFDDLASRTKLQFVAHRAHAGGFLQVTVRVRTTGGSRHSEPL
ncbi:MAG: dihydrofolate reductase family protein [Planctomycetaceae bacterium]